MAQLRSKQVHKVQEPRRRLVHLYEHYQRSTLCGKDKVYWPIVEGSAVTCQHCADAMYGIARRATDRVLGYEPVI